MRSIEVQYLCRHDYSIKRDQSGKPDVDALVYISDARIVTAVFHIIRVNCFGIQSRVDDVLGSPRIAYWKRLEEVTQENVLSPASRPSTDRCQLGASDLGS